MSIKTSIWIKLAIATLTILSTETIAVAQTSIVDSPTDLVIVSKLPRFPQVAQLDRQIRPAAGAQLKPENYFISAQRKYGKKDYKGAMADYTRAIEIDPNFAQGYGGRGTVKHLQLKDYRGALADYNRAIQLRPDLAIVHNFRGDLKAEKLQDYQGALADYNRAIEIDQTLAIAYGGRSELKHDRLNDRAGGIADAQQAARLFKQQGDLENHQIATGILRKWQQTDKKSRR